MIVMSHKWENLGIRYSSIGQSTVCVDPDLETKIMMAIGVDPHGIKVRPRYDDDGNFTEFTPLGYKVPHKLIRHYL